MITNSFIFLDRVGNKLEQNLWKNGIRDWNSFLEAGKINGISSHSKLYFNRKIIEARKHLFESNSRYFNGILPNSEHWRLYDFFKEEAVFLDIETDGLGFGNDITVFGIYNGIDSKTMIEGINLNFNELKNELSKYKLIVTFNGASFDVPFIRKRYPGLLPEVPNFDVKCISSRLGFKGGLKQIEKSMGIQRKEIIKNFNGGDALTLWRMYRATGDEYYLNLLVEYNEMDIINLKIVADKCVKMMKETIFGKMKV